MTPTAPVDEVPSPGSARTAPRWRRRGGIAALALLAAAVASTNVTITGSGYGLFLLRQDQGRPLELKDDLRLGDGPRFLFGISFAPIRALLAPDVGASRLDLEWDEEQGSGIIRNRLPDGRLLETLFGRYRDDEGKNPHGLFVGGAVPDVAVSPEQNQSGMALRDARGWHHVWCNVNELMVVEPEHRSVFPGEWTFLGSRVLVEAPDRVVLYSEHAWASGPTQLRMERFAYFRAGRTWFRLGINVVNLGERPVTLSYGYGDEPWVGTFGTAEGNVGWTERGIVPIVVGIDPRIERWAGILDQKSGVADFIGWGGVAPPDVVYFGNHAGTPDPKEVGEPLTSNEIFIGLEWRNRTLDPGETLSLRLGIGLAGTRPDGSPTAPAGVTPP